MEKNFNTGFGKSVEADRVKLTRRCKRILRKLGLRDELDSTELAEQLLVRTQANRYLARTIQEKDRVLARMDIVLSARDREIKEKECSIAELEGGRKPVKKDNANSSVPPSKNPVSVGIRHTQSQALAFRQENRQARRASGKHPAPIRKCDRNRAMVARLHVSGMQGMLEMGSSSVCGTR